MSELAQNTAHNRMVLMVDSADHITGKTGLTLTLTLSKNGGAFASITPTVTERGSGWYNVAYTTAETNTVGDLALHAVSAGADPTDLLDEVVAPISVDVWDLADGIETGLTPRQAVRLLAAVLAGNAEVTGTGVTFRNALANSKERVEAVINSEGDRAISVLDVT